MIPAPARFTDLREHLHAAQVDAAHLSFTLEHYLSLSDNLPSDSWHLEPHEEHQAWAYREALNTFLQMIIAKPEEGNGDQESETED